MNKIILVTGVIGSGKDYYTQQYIKEHPEEVVIALKFAMPIRDLYSYAVGINLLHAENWEIYKQNPKNREKFINFAEGAKRVLGDNIWARLISEEINGYIHTEAGYTFIISDAGFEIEFKTIYDYLENIYNDIIIHFCNYHSFRYKILDQPREKIPQKLIELGYKDGDELSIYEFNKLII